MRYPGADMFSAMECRPFICPLSSCYKFHSELLRCISWGTINMAVITGIVTELSERGLNDQHI